MSFSMAAMHAALPSCSMRRSTRRPAPAFTSSSMNSGCCATIHTSKFACTLCFHRTTSQLWQCIETILPSNYLPGVAAPSGLNSCPTNGSTVFAMRHRKGVPKLNRPADQRKAMLRSLTTETLRYGKITTTKVTFCRCRSFMGMDMSRGCRR
jgi:hypothetical protein